MAQVEAKWTAGTEQVQNIFEPNICLNSIESLSLHISIRSDYFLIRGEDIPYLGTGTFNKYENIMDRIFVFYLICFKITSLIHKEETRLLDSKHCKKETLFRAKLHFDCSKLYSTIMFCIMIVIFVFSAWNALKPNNATVYILDIYLISIH